MLSDFDEILGCISARGYFACAQYATLRPPLIGRRTVGWLLKGCRSRLL